jgi:glutathione S-transferase
MLTSPHIQTRTHSHTHAHHNQIPVLLTPDGETAVQDTTDIIDFLERRCDDSTPLFRVCHTP